MEVIEATIVTAFHKNGWHRLKLEDGTTCVGFSSTTPSEGMHVQFVGEWHTDPKWGRQFKFSSCISLNVQGNEQSIIRWLTLFPGIGPAKAADIYRLFGNDVYNILKNDASRLLEVNGIGPTVVERVRKDFEDQRSLWSFYTQLGEQDLVGDGSPLTDLMVKRIFSFFAEDSLNVIIRHPYRLTLIHGIGFQLADGIARKSAGFSADDPERLQGAIFYALTEAKNGGDACMKFADVITDASDALHDGDSSISQKSYDELVHEELTGLIRRGSLKGYEDHVYLNSMWNTETYIVDRLTQYTNETTIPLSRAMELAEIAAAQITQERGIVLDPAQKRSVATALMSSLSIVTGPPGSGKSATVRAIVLATAAQGLRLSLCAPSGKASRVLSEASGRTASTIHRLLGAKSPSTLAPDESSYTFNENNKLSTDLVILDESTMVELSVFEALLKATNPDTKFVLVGDVDQLPSVGPCLLFKDVIDSRRFPVTRFTEVYRQREGSSIGLAAVAIKNGKAPDWSDLRENEIIESEVKFITENDAKLLPQTLVNSALELIRLGTPIEEVQITIPQNKGSAGAPVINWYFQKAIGKWAFRNRKWEFVGPHLRIGKLPIPRDLQYPKNPEDFSSEELMGRLPSDMLVGVGDRVIHTVNNYDLEVFNGDVGVIDGVDVDSGILSVKYPFKEELVYYDVAAANQLSLAYALSVHRMQGSQARAIVVGMHTTHFVMLQRDLLYTAVSRAKERCWVVGTNKAVRIAAKTYGANKRVSLLSKRLAVEAATA